MVIRPRHMSQTIPSTRNNSLQHLLDIAQMLMPMLPQRPWLQILIVTPSLHHLLKDLSHIAPGIQKLLLVARQLQVPARVLEDVAGDGCRDGRGEGGPGNENILGRFFVGFPSYLNVLAESGEVLGAPGGGVEVFGAAETIRCVDGNDSCYENFRSV